MIRPTKVIRGKVNAAVIHEYPELENIEITPTVEDQVYKSDMYGFDEVKVKGVQAYIDEDIKPEYIVDGVDILGVIGNYKGIDTSDATVTTEDVLSGKIVYINNEKQIGTMPNNGELQFEPSDEEQVIPNGYTSGGSVLPADITKLDEYDKCLTIINSIEDMSEYSDTTATPEDIVEGKTAYSNGERIVGKLKTSSEIIVSYEEPIGENRKTFWLQRGKNLCKVEITPGAFYSTNIAHCAFAYINYFVKKGQTYTFSTNALKSVTKFNTRLLISEKKFPTDNEADMGFAILNFVGSVTFTPEKDGYIGFTMWQDGYSDVFKSNVTPSVPTQLNRTYWFQLEEGSEATEYEEHIQTKLYMLNENNEYVEIK